MEFLQESAAAAPSAAASVHLPCHLARELLRHILSSERPYKWLSFLSMCVYIRVSVHCPSRCRRSLACPLDLLMHTHLVMTGERTEGNGTLPSHKVHMSVLANDRLSTLLPRPLVSSLCDTAAPGIVVAQNCQGATILGVQDACIARSDLLTKGSCFRTVCTGRRCPQFSTSRAVISGALNGIATFVWHTATPSSFSCTATLQSNIKDPLAVVNCTRKQRRLELDTAPPDGLLHALSATRPNQPQPCKAALTCPLIALRPRHAAPRRPRFSNYTRYGCAS